MKQLRIFRKTTSTPQGVYRTRKPRSIMDSLEERVSDPEDGLLLTLNDEAKKSLKTGAGLQSVRHSLAEKVPAIKWDKIGQASLYVGAGALAWWMAKFGAKPDSMYHGIYNFLNNYTPDGVSYTISAIIRNAKVDAAVLNLLSWALPLMGLAKGVSIKKLVSNISRSVKEEQIAAGTYPVKYVGHVVASGLEDSIASAVNGRNTFTDYLREDFGQVVLIQKNPEYWEGEDQETRFNDKKLYVDLNKFVSARNPIPETIMPAIVSGAYQAGGLIINGHQDFELFESITPRSGGRSQFEMGAHLAKNANVLREVMFEEAPQLRVSIVVPQYLNQEGFTPTHKSWTYTIQANFMTEEGPPIDGVVVPEVVFLNMVLKELQAHGDLHKKIYIDAEGESNLSDRATRCMEGLQALYKYIGVEPPEMIIDPYKAKEAQVSILLRGRNKSLRPQVAMNIHESGHERVYYATTERRESIDHPHNLRAEQRVPIFYKAEIAKTLLEHLQGVQNEWSLSNLVEKGVLQYYR